MKQESALILDTNVLDAVPFLQGLRHAHLKTLDDCAMKTSFAGGEIIFREGEPANRFYAILNGSVALESPGGKHETVCIQTLGAGDVFGWSWLFPPYRWHFNARALEPTSVIFFYGTRLREHCETDPELGRELVTRMAEMMMWLLQATRRQLSDISILALHSQWEALRLAAMVGTPRRSTKKSS